MPGRKIGRWWRAGAPEASATGRDRNPEATYVLLTRPFDTGGNSAGELPVGRGEGPCREACTASDRHLGTALQRLITQRRLVEPLLAVGPVGQVKVSEHRPPSPAPGAAGTGQGGRHGRRGGARNGWRVGRPVGGCGRLVG